MEPNNDVTIFNTKAGIFAYIISCTLGLVAALYVVFFGTGNRFMAGFGVVMSFSMYKAIRNAARMLYVDKTTMTHANMNNPFLTMGSIIATTVLATSCLAVFIPILSENIEKGNMTSITLCLLTVTVQGYCFYRCMHNVNKFLRKRTVIYSYNR